MSWFVKGYLSNNESFSQIIDGVKKKASQISEEKYQELIYVFQQEIYQSTKQLAFMCLERKGMS